jgi:hypothetical protein
VIVAPGANWTEDQITAILAAVRRYGFDFSRIQKLYKSLPPEVRSAISGQDVWNAIKPNRSYESSPPGSLGQRILDAEYDSLSQRYLYSDSDDDEETAFQRSVMKSIDDDSVSASAIASLSRNGLCGRPRKDGSDRVNWLTEDDNEVISAVRRFGRSNVKAIYHSLSPSVKEDFNYKQVHSHLKQGSVKFRSKVAAADAIFKRRRAGMAQKAGSTYAVAAVDAIGADRAQRKARRAYDKTLSSRKFVDQRDINRALQNALEAAKVTWPSSPAEQALAPKVDRIFRRLPPDPKGTCIATCATTSHMTNATPPPHSTTRSANQARDQ